MKKIDYLKQLMNLLKDNSLSKEELDKELSILAVKMEAYGHYDIMDAIDRLRELKNGPRPVPKESIKRFFDAIQKACDSVKRKHHDT